MWYSALSVGILEIDLQHANIDQILSELTDHNRQEVVNRITDALIRHFKAEEMLCAEKDLHMSEDHKKEHVRLTEMLQNLKQQMQKVNPDREAVLRTYSDLIVEHVTRFDSTICNSRKANYEPLP
jgi:hemerythrin-like metal-binding protein